MIYFLVITSLALTVAGECLTLPVVECDVDHGDSIYIIYGWLRVMATTLVLLQVFILVPYENMKLKSITFMHFCWGFFNCITTAGIEPSWMWYTPLVFAQFMVFGLYILHRTFVTLELPSDKYTTNSVYIVCKKPQNMLDFMFSFMARPMSSISVVSSGIWFGYTFGKKYYQEPYIENERDCYLKVNVTHEYVLSRLETLQGAKWSVFNNCCHAVMRLYPDIKIGILNMLPCFFIKQLMRYKNDR